MVRYFPSESAGEPPVAKFLDVILYSREQIHKEAEAMGREVDDETACAACHSLEAWNAPGEDLGCSHVYPCTSTRGDLRRLPQAMGHHLAEGADRRLRVANAAHHDDAERPRQGGRRQWRAARARKVHGIGGILDQACEHQVSRRIVRSLRGYV